MQALIASIDATLLPAPGLGLPRAGLGLYGSGFVLPGPG